ncbi:MAG TPA: zinc ribbon domain-containing protein [Phycisphaerae bacterium]|nr:zinc ribbon domain-containing protein [Phycisphaerae bacterium]
MPTYEYQCQQCGHDFEQYQQITARPLRRCPSCGQTALKRLIGTGAGVLFRGSGFYQTDYRSAGYKEAAKKDKPEGAAGSVGSDSKSPKKSETKAGASGKAASDS